MPAGAAGGSREDADPATEPQQCLYFRPLPHKQGWLGPDFTVSTVAHSAAQPPHPDVRGKPGPVSATPVFKSRRREEVVTDMAIMRRDSKIMTITTSTASGSLRQLWTREAPAGPTGL